MSEVDIARVVAVCKQVVEYDQDSFEKDASPYGSMILELRAAVDVGDAAENDRLRRMLREVWARMERDFILPYMLGDGLAVRLRSEFEGEDPHDDSGF